MAKQQNRIEFQKDSSKNLDEVSPAFWIVQMNESGMLLESSTEPCQARLGRALFDPILPRETWR